MNSWMVAGMSALDPYRIPLVFGESVRDLAFWLPEAIMWGDECSRRARIAQFSGFSKLGVFFWSGGCWNCIGSMPSWPFLVPLKSSRTSVSDFVSAVDRIVEKSKIFG